MKLGSSCVAAGVIVIAAGISAKATQIDLSGLVNADLNAYSNGFMYPPSGGSLTVGGIGFNLATYGGGTGIIQLNFGDALIPINEAGVTTVYTLINSAFGGNGTNIGALNFTGSSGSYTYTLTEGYNVRDHFNGFFVNTATNLATSSYFGDGSVRLDEQAIVLPGGLGTLLAIDFIGYGQGGSGEPFLAAVTTSDASPTPLPSTWLMLLGGLAALGFIAHRGSNHGLPAAAFAAA